MEKLLMRGFTFSCPKSSNHSVYWTLTAHLTSSWLHLGARLPVARPPEPPRALRWRQGLVATGGLLPPGHSGCSLTMVLPLSLSAALPSFPIVRTNYSEAARLGSERRVPLICAPLRVSRGTFHRHRYLHTMSCAGPDFKLLPPAFC